MFIYAIDARTFRDGRVTSDLTISAAVVGGMAQNCGPAKTGLGKRKELSEVAVRVQSARMRLPYYQNKLEKLYY